MKHRTAILLLALAAASCRNKPATPGEPAPGTESAICEAGPEQAEDAVQEEPSAGPPSIVQMARTRDPDGLIVTPLPGGGFLLVWSDWRDGNILARRFDARGAPAGDEVKLVDSGMCESPPMEPAPCWILGPALALADDGSLTLSWSEEKEAGPGKTITMVTSVQRFSAGLEPTGERIRLDAPAITAIKVCTDVAAKDIAAGEETTFHVAWTRPVEEWMGSIRTLSLGPDGTPAAKASTLASGKKEHCPDLERIPGSGYAVAWKSGKKILGQVRSTGLEPEGDAFVISGSGGCPDLKTLEDGSLVAAWKDGDVFLRVYGPDGEPKGPATPVTGDEHASRFAKLTSKKGEPGVGYSTPVIAADPRGGLVVVWESRTADSSFHFGIYGRRYTAEGEPVGAEIVIEDAPVKWKTTSNLDAAFLEDGTLVVAWWQRKRLHVRLLGAPIQ